MFPYGLADNVVAGDEIRGGQIEDIADLLRLGVRVALIYGDADYIVRISLVTVVEPRLT